MCLSQLSIPRDYSLVSCYSWPRLWMILQKYEKWKKIFPKLIDFTNELLIKSFFCQSSKILNLWLPSPTHLHMGVLGGGSFLIRGGWRGGEEVCSCGSFGMIGMIFNFNLFSQMAIFSSWISRVVSIGAFFYSLCHFYSTGVYSKICICIHPSSQDIYGFSSFH